MESSQFIALGLGSIVGFLLSLTGAGGAILSVPLLGFGLHLSVAQAGPIGLLAVCLSSGIGAFLGLRSGILRYRAASFMAIFGLVMAPIGIWLAKLIPNRPMVIGFAMLLVVVSMRMLVAAYREMLGIATPDKRPPPCMLNQSIGRLIWTVPCARSLAAAGALAGFFSGLLGVGGGFIIVPSLKHSTDLPIKSIVATSLGVLTMVSFGSVLIATVSGTMIWPLAVPFASGALMGMIVGQHFAKKISGPRLQQFFALFTFFIAITMMYKAFA